jgi:hypothetical protein
LVVTKSTAIPEIQESQIFAPPQAILLPTIENIIHNPPLDNTIRVRIHVASHKIGRGMTASEEMPVIRRHAALQQRIVGCVKY